jgi:hypothetical protein
MSSEWSSIVSTLAEDDSSSGAFRTDYKNSQGPQRHAYELLQDLCKEVTKHNISFRPGRFSTYEIVNYYVVGFVTCLEWQARSRIVDLLNFVPDCIQPEDVRAIDKLALSQMSAANVTLPFIVGAGTHVSSAQDYASIFTRVFDGIGLETNAEKLLRGQLAEQHELRPAQEPATIYDVIGELFEARHSLVHEINGGLLGHYTLRDIWTPEDALRGGSAVGTAMESMEKVITERAPTDFPNRLSADGFAEDELEKLSSQISQLENNITEKTRTDDSANEWVNSLALNRAAFDAEARFIDEAQFLKPGRHWNFRRPAKIAYLRGRLSYLKAILSQLD